MVLLGANAQAQIWKKPIEIGMDGQLQVTTEAAELLALPSIKAFLFSDADERVVGFGGLAVAPMHHRFDVDGRALWTWCAWDGLFIPMVLGMPAQIESRDPETGEAVRLTVTAEGIVSGKAEIVLSFLLPQASEFRKSGASVMTTFCHFVFFFASRDSGDRWTFKHPGTFLYSLDDAMVLASRFAGLIDGHARSPG